MGMVQDFRFALRMLLKNKGVTIVATIALALGIGVNATVFTLVNAVLIKGLPFENPDEIVFLRSRNQVEGSERGLSYPDLRDWREQNQSFQGLAAYGNRTVNLSDDREVPERAAVGRVTANTFSLLNQPVLLGRGFAPGEDGPGAEHVAIIGHGIWQSRYGGDEAVVGQTLRLDDAPYTIIGVMPRGMEFPNNNDLWIPLDPEENQERRGARTFATVGRLRPGVSIEEAETELTSITARLAAEYPETNEGIDARVISTQDFYNGGPIRMIFLSLLGAVSFVLLIACANVANLLLSQAVHRSRETAVRTAMGASRWRIIRQLLIESFGLSAIGAALGLLIAVVGVRLFDAAVADVGKPYWIDFSMDLTVYVYLLVVAFGTTVLFGLAPALHTSRTDINTHLKEGSQASMGGVRAGRLGGVLVVGQLTLTVVLLAGAGLMIRSFMEMRSVDLGVGTQDVAIVSVTLPDTRYPEASDRLRFQERITDELASMAGVDAFAVASAVPAGGTNSRSLELEGRDLGEGPDGPPSPRMVAITPDYFKAFEVPIMRGRLFTRADGGAGADVAIVNQRFVAMFFPDEDALGKRLRLGGSESPWLQIVGVSLDIRYGSLQELAPDPVVFVPYKAEPAFTASLVARGSISSEALLEAMRRAVQRVDPTLPTFNAATLAAQMQESTWPYRVFGSLFTILAAVGLILSSVGVFGVTAYAVSQRTREIGMRMALGAVSNDVLWLITRQGVRYLAISLTLGLIASAGVTRVLGSLMFRIGTTDPTTFMTIPLVLSLVTIAACVLPAQRAATIDPMRALRAE